MINNSFLSKYIYTFEYDNNQTILYNSLNGSIVLLENKYLDNDFKSLDMDQKKQLEEMGFLLDSSKAYQQIIEAYDNCKSDRLSMIIELTQKCNLRCIYCYQEEWIREDRISNDTIEKVLKYIENCIKSEDYKVMDVNFIGGEPIIEQEFLLLIYDKLIKLCKELNVKLQIDIDTNGVLLTREFLEKLENVNLSVSLTMPNDHNVKRLTLDGQATYDTIINNLIKCKDIFESSEKNCNLVIRYNIDQENKIYFSKFLDDLQGTGLKFTVYTAYTFEHECNPYKNTWDLNSYKIWNSSECIDLLIERNLLVTHKPNISISPCKAYYKHNLKIFSDGYLGLCNGYYPNLKKYKIDDVYNNINRVIELFPEKKEKPFNNVTCNNCRELAICGGTRFCKEKFCEYGFVNLEAYVKTYVKHILNGNDNFFPF